MIKLGDNSFVVPPPAGMRSFALQQKILPVAGRVANVFLQLLGVSADLTSLVEMDVLKVLPQALPYVGQIFSEMPPGELESITRELLRDAKCDNLPLFGAPGGDLFDGRMQGRTSDTWKLLWHALEVWYPDFFGRARSLIATGAKASPSAESTTSQPAGPAGG